MAAAAYPELDTALALLRSFRALAARAVSSPVDYVDWMPIQLAFLSHQGSGPRLLRLGNRQGKSFAGAALLVFTARCDNPFGWAPDEPNRSALVCDSKAQSVEIQRLIWEHVGGRHNDELIEGCAWNAKTGFGGHRPLIQWKNGSTVTCYTNSQGAIAMAGAEFDGVVVLDEPPERSVYDEAVARVYNTAGRVALTLTPINGPPLPWLREMTESQEDGNGGNRPPQVTEYHSRLTPESQIGTTTGLVRLTADGRTWDADLIEELERACNPIDAPIRIHGEWESRTEGQYFACFNPALHVCHPEATPSGTPKLDLGVDYAAADRELGMCATLTAEEQYKLEDGSIETRFWVWAEVVVPGTTTMEHFAGAIVAELTRLGIDWHELDDVWGDQPVRSKYETASNLHLQKYVARRLRKRPKALRPAILSVKEGGGASNRARRTKDLRCRWFYGEIASGRVQIHPRCRYVIQGLLEWDYTDRHPLKDILDGTMYGLKRHWAEGRWRTNPVQVVVG